MPVFMEKSGIKKRSVKSSSAEGLKNQGEWPVLRQSPSAIYGTINTPAHKLSTKQGGTCQ